MPGDAVLMKTFNEWMTACEVQQRFMQHSGPTIDTLSYSARCRQVGELGGDCYDFVPLLHNRLALAVGDASGKGLAAALMISNVQSSLRMAASFAEDDGAAVLRAVNRQVYASSLSLCLVILWRFRWSNAHATICECRPQSADAHSTRPLDHLV
jgi:serine phosphatase RsbU (regulator of sigma subunit)